MKQIAVLTLGSRGDVQPFVALCLALRKFGLKAKLISYSQFEDLAKEYDVPFSSIRHSYEEKLVEILRSHTNPLTIPQEIQKNIGSTIDKVLMECWFKCQGSDAIVSAGTAFWGYDIAEKLRIPSIAVGLLPLRPTKEFPACAGPQVNINSTFNKLSALFVGRTFWNGFKESINRWREETLGLSAWREVPFESSKWENQLELLAYSSTLVPQPSDWKDNVYTTGFWFLEQPEGFSPQPDLVEFLSQEAKPIYVGFGSMKSEKSIRRKLANVFLNAVKATGQKYIFSGDLAAEITPKENIFCIDSIPHDWLLPQVSLAIHHGGAGTTGASLKAACPSLVMPFFSDQYFWANRLVKAGASPKVLRKEKISEQEVINMLQQMKSIKQYHLATKKLSSLLNQEGGVDYAASLISKYISAGSK